MRQLTVGTYELGDRTAKVLPRRSALRADSHTGEEDRPPHRLAFYLPASTVVLLLERLPE